jgi:hypothetical protein
MGPMTVQRPARGEMLVFTLHVMLLTCLLGIAIDAVTANVAVEYFTVHHPHVVNSDSPWVMAIVWGVGASWWFALIAALLLWWVNSRRTQPLPRRRILRMVIPALVFIWLTMITGSVYTVAGFIPVQQRRPSFESDRRLMSVALAHATEYALGGFVTVVLMVRSSGDVDRIPSRRQSQIDS